VSTAAATHGVVTREKSPFALLVLLPLGGIFTAIAAVASNGNPVIAIAPLLLAVGAYALYVTPVRHVVVMTIFLALTLDAVDEGPWNSPLAKVGSLFAVNLNKTIPISALTLPGIAFLMVLLLGVIFHRRQVGNRIDGRAETAKPVLIGLAVSFLSLLALCALGAVKGGDMQMAKIQVQQYAMTLLMAFLVAMSFRGVRDYRMLGRLIVVSAFIRALYAAYVEHIIPPPPGDAHLNVTATHGDSLLFAAAVVLLVVRFLERPSARAAAWCVTVLPVLALGMVANNRRLVWVEIAAGLVLFALLSRRSYMKRLMANLLLASLPLFAVYVAVGWNSSSKIFAPVKTFRSVGDSNVDSSTMYRDLENYNLLLTMRFNPITGAGFGQPFAETVTLPSISFFREYRYMPHNSILGLWAFTGPLGFAGIWVAPVIAIFMASRAYTRARTSDERVAAFMVTAMVVIWLAHCWGDIGFSERRVICLVGPVLAMAGQLACATGAWRPSRQRSLVEQAA
jgi:O-Antigen ligase